MADHLTKGQIQDFTEAVEKILSRPRPSLHDNVAMIEYLTLSRAREAILEALEDIYGQPVERKIPAPGSAPEHRTPVDQYIMENH